MSPAALTDGYTARTATFSDAQAVAELIAACQRAVGDRSGMTLEELLEDWQEITLSENAVAVEAPDGRLVAYADVINRSYVSVSVYGTFTLSIADAGSGRSWWPGARGGRASGCTGLPPTREW